MGRQSKITYGGFVVGAGTRYKLTDVHLTDRSYSRFTISFSVVIQAASSGETVAAIQVLADALEEAYRKPFQDLLVEIGGAVWWDFKHSTNTALNPEPSIELDPAHRSARSRQYNCVISLGLPADLAGKGFRQTTSFQILTDPVGLDTVGLEVVFTAVPGGVDALAKARADFLDFRDALLIELFPATALADWDRSAQEQYFPDEEKKTCRAAVTTVGLLWPRPGAASLDLSIFTGLTFTLDVFRQVHEGFAPLRAEAPFGASVTFTVGAKLPNQNLDALLEDTLIPYFQSLLESELSAVTSPVQTGRQVSFEPTSNTISGTLRFSVFGSSVISATLVTEESIYEGVTLIPVLDKTPFSRDQHDSPGARTRAIVFDVLELAGASAGGSTAPFLQAVAQAQAEGFILVDKPVNRTRVFTYQEQAGTGSSVRQLSFLWILEFADLKGGGGGGTTTGAGDSSIGQTRTRTPAQLQAQRRAAKAGRVRTGS